MRVLDAGAIEPKPGEWPALIDAAAASLVALATGAADAPLRTALSLHEGQLLTMPGRLSEAEHAIVKLVTVVPTNVDRGLPTVQAIAMVFNAHTGEAIAQLDGTVLTAVRTGAISAAAVRALTSPASGVLAVAGAGAQAPWQVRAIGAVMPLREVRIWAPSDRRRSALAASLTSELDIPVRALTDLEEATDGADIICAATTATQPFLTMATVPEGKVVIVAIGAFRPDMAEIDVSVLERAGRVYVDDVPAALAEGGDVMAALAAGVIEEDEIRAVGEVIAGGDMPSEGVTIFKSVGSAVEDAAVAGALLARQA